MKQTETRGREALSTWKSQLWRFICSRWTHIGENRWGIFSLGKGSESSRSGVHAGKTDGKHSETDSSIDKVWISAWSLRCQAGNLRLKPGMPARVVMRTKGEMSAWSAGSQKSAECHSLAPEVPPDRSGLSYGMARPMTVREQM